MNTVEWTIANNGPRVVHPAPCGCGCYCSKTCGCNGKTCNCELCDIYAEVGVELTEEQMERLSLCDCDICKRAKPDAGKRFSKLIGSVKGEKVCQVP